MIYIFTLIILSILFLIDKEKTIRSIKRGFKKLFIQLPVFLTMSALVAVSLHFISDEVIAQHLGRNSSIFGLFNASIIGSIAIMPGFIAFPLGGILLTKGVPYMVLGGFTNTLMMVGVASFPVEKEYFGVKVSILRNFIGYIISIIVALIIGIFYGEVF